MINIPSPQGIAIGLVQFFSELLRRAVDGTVSPFFVDLSNARVGVNVSAPAVAFEVSGDSRVNGQSRVGNLIVTGQAAVGNLDVPGSGTFSVLGSTAKTNLNNLDVFGASRFWGNASFQAGGGVILSNSSGTRNYLLSITEVTNDDGAISPVISLTLQ